MDNRMILQTAMRQSAVELHVAETDFQKDRNVVALAEPSPLARKYYTEPIACNLVSYGSNVVAAVKAPYRAVVEEYLGRFRTYECFETPNVLWLNDRLRKMGQKVCFMAEYWLPDVDSLTARSSPYEIRILHAEDFQSLYLPEWRNALSEKRRELDVLGAGAYDNGKLIGLAGCSADCEDMWQIGIDVLPEYRRQGIASALTGRLAQEILNRDKVPFYCCAWSNVASARNAVRSGFRPAWVELTVKPAAFVDQMNGEARAAADP